jgi:hypothetical protein
VLSLVGFDWAVKHTASNYKALGSLSSGFQVETNHSSDSWREIYILRHGAKTGFSLQIPTLTQTSGASR